MPIVLKEINWPMSRPLNFKLKDFWRIIFQKTIFWRITNSKFLTLSIPIMLRDPKKRKTGRKSGNKRKSLTLLPPVSIRSLLGIPTARIWRNKSAEPVKNNLSKITYYNYDKKRYYLNKYPNLPKVEPKN